MKKKILSMFLSLSLIIVSLFTFSGCDLLHDNSKRYYAEVVATVGGEEITRNEVLTMFNYYYYTMGYYQYGYSEDVVYKMVIEALVKNKIMTMEAKKLEECKLNDEDIYYIWEQVFNNVNSQIDTNETEIKALLGIKEEAKEEEEKKDLPVFKEYEKTIPTGEIAEAEVKRTKAEWMQDLQNSTNRTANYYRSLAYSKYIEGLKESAANYDGKVKSDSETLEAELERLYKYYEESRLVEKYTAYMANKLTVSADEINQEYTKALNTQVQQFAIANGYSTKIKDTSNTDLVIYRQNGDYYTVQHILLQFDDYDKELKASNYLYNLDNYVSAKDANTSLEQPFIDAFLAERENYALNTEDSLNMDYINPETGETNKDKDGKDVSYTLADFDALINGPEGIYTKYKNGDITYEQLAKEFFKLKFSFSKDGGVTDLTSLTNLVGYTLPKSTAEESGFVAEFAETCYELYDQFLEPEAGEKEYGIKRVVTNFGVHYIMFTGVINSGNLSLDDEFTLVSDQTVEEYFYEKLMASKQQSLSADVGSALYNQYLNDGKIEIKYDTYDECL